MNKHFKFFLTSAAVAAALVGAVSCQKDLSSDVDALKQQVQTLSNDLSTLQQQIKDGEIVTAVKPIANGIEVTTNKGTYQIVNGTDGAKGVLS